MNKLSYIIIFLKTPYIRIILIDCLFLAIILRWVEKQALDQDDM